MNHFQVVEISQSIYRFSFTTDNPGKYEFLGYEFVHPNGEKVVSHCITARAEHVAKELIKKASNNTTLAIASHLSAGFACRMAIAPPVIAFGH